MKVSELKPLEKNPFKSVGDEQIKKIAKSIQEFERMMEIRRIVIDEDNNILGGNKRYFALKKLGYKEIPDAWIEKVEGLSEEQKKEFIVKDNAHWDGKGSFSSTISGFDNLDSYSRQIQALRRAYEELNATNTRPLNSIRPFTQEEAAIRSVKAEYDALVAKKNQVDAELKKGTEDVAMTFVCNA